MYRVDTGDGNEFQNEFYMRLCIYSLHITVLVKESPTALYTTAFKRFSTVPAVTKKYYYNDQS